MAYEVSANGAVIAATIAVLASLVIVLVAVVRWHRTGKPLHRSGRTRDRIMAMLLFVALATLAASLYGLLLATLACLLLIVGQWFTLRLRSGD